jgi:hypothetical protein
MLSAVALAMLATSAAALSACGSSATPSSSSGTNENVGTVKADLVATGPNGVVYAMPQNAVFVLTKTGDAGSPQELFFDSTSNATETFSVPVGTYTGVLQGGPPWQLLNTSNMSIANANLLDTQPFNVTITANTVTPLSFHFMLAGVGNVTFGTGSLQTSFSVAASDGGSPTTGNWSATGLNIQGVQGPAGLPTLVSTINAASPSTFGFMNTPFQITTPFTAEVDSACANFTANQTMPTGETIPNNDTADVDLFSEGMGTGAVGTICVFDPNGSQVTNEVEIQFSRTGAAQSSTIQGAVGAQGGSFFSIIIASASTSLYDGKTAQLTQLASPTTLQVVETAELFDPGQGQETDAFGTNAGGTLTLQLTP